MSHAAIADNFAKKLAYENEPLIENLDKHISLSWQRGKRLITRWPGQIQ
jgi:hypothetical protein